MPVTIGHLFFNHLKSLWRTLEGKFKLISFLYPPKKSLRDWKVTSSHESLPAVSVVLY